MLKHSLKLTLCLCLAGAVACGDSKDTNKNDSADTAKSSDKGDKKGAASGALASGSASSAPATAGTAAPSAPTTSGGGAAAHLTKDCDIAGRLDVSQLVNYPPFAKEIAPILDEMLATPNPKDEGFQKLQAFLKENGLDYKTSLKDVAFCVQGLDGEPTFSVAIGGNFKPESLVTAIDKVRKKKDVPLIDIDGRKALSDDKFTFGQFADGTVGLAQKLDVFKAMNATGDAATSVYKLDTSKMLSAATAEGAIAKALAKSPPKGKGADLLNLIKTARMSTDLAKNQTLITLVCASTEDASKLNAYLTVAKSEFEKNPSGAPFPNADKLLKATKLTSSGTEVGIEITQSQADTEQAIKLLASQLKQAKAQL